MQYQLDELDKSLLKLWAPAPRLSLSEYADEYFYLSPESSASQGKWQTLPYQKEILNCIGNSEIEVVSCLKSARVGWTKCLNIAICYYIHYDPCGIMLVQPTIADAEGYSKEEIEPMIRDVPVLADLFGEIVTKNKSQTILNKKFRGGVLSMVGANSPTGFRRVSRKVILLDEIDGYPSEAGDEGDQVKLASKRGEGFYDRKICLGSTPTIDTISKIQTTYSQGDMRRFEVPCPHCTHMDFFTFDQNRKSGVHWHPNDVDRGHFMYWPKGKPEKACFVCRNCGDFIDHKHKFEIIEEGKWIARMPFENHASFAIWSAYSYLPKAKWANIAKEYDSIKSEPQKKVFFNTWAGEPYAKEVQEQDSDSLYLKRQNYEIGKVPAKAYLLTLGVDVQKDGFYYEVVGWGENRQSWSVDSGFIAGKIESSDRVWEELDRLYESSFEHDSGVFLKINKMAIDSGAYTSKVYAWCRKKPMTNVIAIKGMPQNSRMMVGNPVKIDFNEKGIRVGYSYWPVYVKLIKDELFAQLLLSIEENKEPPDGYCHFPEYEKKFFEQMTSENLVTTTSKSGKVSIIYELKPNCQNHFLDCRVYARAAAYILGIDWFSSEDWKNIKSQIGIKLETKQESTISLAEKEIKEDLNEVKEVKKENWLPKTKGFLSKR